MNDAIKIVALRDELRADERKARLVYEMFAGTPD